MCNDLELNFEVRELGQIKIIENAFILLMSFIKVSPLTSLRWSQS